MDTKVFITVIAGVLVSALILGAFVPIFSEVTATEDEFSNDGYYHMEKYGVDDDITIEWNHSEPKIITVNGIDYTLSLPYNTWTSLVVGDDWYLRYADGNTVQFTQTSYGGISYLSASTTDAKDLTIVCSNGTADISTATEGTVSNRVTATYTELYIISGDAGSYVMKAKDGTAYMTATSDFVALGVTQLQGSDRCILRIDGNIEDGANVDVIASTVTDTTITDVTVNTSELPSHKGYSLSTITFVAVADGTDTDVTYSYFIVPSEVSIERNVHGDEAFNSVIDIIPLVAGVGLLMGAVYYFISRR